ncbi:MAG: S8 family serine peptidase [Myxococcota bacterium]
MGKVTRSIWSKVTRYHEKSDGQRDWTSRARWMAGAGALALAGMWLWPSATTTSVGTLHERVDLTLDEREGPGMDEASLRETDSVQVSSLATRTLELNGRNVEVRDGVALVKPRAEAEAEAWLASIGSRVLRKSPSGYWRVSVPEGGSLDVFLATLKEQRVIEASQPEGVVRAASLADGTATYRAYQWNLDQIGWNYRWFGDDIDMPALATVTVAVIDSGVAYENYTTSTHTYVASPDLAGSPVAAGYDFVGDDTHANDLSGHGTHIANIIAANGGSFGVSPGVGIMPVRVLDGGNAGNELDLVDAILFATSNGADILNMSLSFPYGYIPGSAMSAAMQTAFDNNCVVVVAAGNEAASDASYPSAYVEAISVGASRLTSGRKSWVANYSNFGPSVDVTAPGGDGSLDVNNDGKVDGIVAQSIEAGNPSALHYYLMSGTSQAAAHVSGTAALLLALGADPDVARSAIVTHTNAIWGSAQFATRQEMGVISALRAKNYVENNPETLNQNQYFVNVLPLLYVYGGKWATAGLIQVIDTEGKPAKGKLVAGHWFGTSSSTFGVITNNKGQAVVATVSTVTTSSSSPVAFGLQVDRVVDGNGKVSLPPRSFYYVSEGYYAALKAWNADPVTQGAAILMKAQPGVNNMPSWIATQYVTKPLGPLNAWAPVAITSNQAYLNALTASNPNGYQPLTVTFSTPQSFGWGTSSSVTAEVAQDVTLLNGSVLSLAIVPMDPSIYFTNLTGVSPIVNAPSSTWVSENLSFLQNMNSSLTSSHVVGVIIGDALNGYVISSHVVGVIIGDHVVGVIIGDHVVGVIIGDGMMAQVLGTSVTSSVDENGDSTIMADHVVGVIIGDSVSLELLGSSVNAPVMVASSVANANSLVAVPMDASAFSGTADTIFVTPDE